jgi:hypothetical protein
MDITVDMAIIASAMPPLFRKILFKLTRPLRQKAPPKESFGAQL